MVGLAQFVAEPVRLLAMAGQMIAGARASAGRLATVLSTPLVLTPGTRADALPARGIDLTDVGYRTLTGLT